ncbi:MAG: phosphatidylglycerophosphatase A [Bryobacteraceae bacterium]
MNRLALTISTFFGCGYFPKGPGTIGSLAALAIVAFLYRFLGMGRSGLFLLFLVSLPVAVWSATTTSRLLNKKDPGQVVIDEVVGQWLTLLAPTAWNWKSFLAAFLLFRLFDIWKPQPVRAAESLPEGLGIVADDVIAGVYAALILYIGASVGARLRIV